MIFIVQAYVLPNYCFQIMKKITSSYKICLSKGMYKNRVKKLNTTVKKFKKNFNKKLKLQNKISHFL